MSGNRFRARLVLRRAGARRKEESSFSSAICDFELSTGAGRFANSRHLDWQLCRALGRLRPAPAHAAFRPH